MICIPDGGIEYGFCYNLYQHCPALKISGRISIFMLTDDLLSMYDIKGKKIERRSLPGWRRARPESAACRAFFRRAEKGGY